MRMLEHEAGQKQRQQFRVTQFLMTTSKLV